MSEVLLDRAGRRRSPATMPGFHAGRSPRNRGLRYPADPPKVEEIVAVMCAAGEGPHGQRLRGLIVICGGQACGSKKRCRWAKPTSTSGAGRCSSARAREDVAAKSGWTYGAGNNSSHGSTHASSSQLDRCFALSPEPRADGTGPTRPREPICAGLPPELACGGASPRTSSGTRTPSRWPAKAFRWSLSSASSDIAISASPRSISKALTTRRSSTPSTPAAPRWSR